MPFSSASPLTSSLATVFEFLPALARRHLACRIGSRGSIQVLATSPGVFTLALQQRVQCGGDVIENRFAQLRVTGDDGGDDCYQLYWKNGSGRWTAYCGQGTDPLRGSIDECLSEIARDPCGCYWS